MRRPLVLVLLAGIAITVVVLNTGDDRDVARGAGSASMALTGARATPVEVGSSVELSVELTSFAPTTQQDAWAGISAVLTYDPAVVAVRDSRPGELAECSGRYWHAFARESGRYFIDCGVQDSIETGRLAIVEIACLSDGTTDVMLAEPAPQRAGSELIDRTAAPIATSLLGTRVICGTGIRDLSRPTVTPQPQPTQAPALLPEVTAPAHAEMAIAGAPSDPVATGGTFEITVDITRFTPSTEQPFWAGYNIWVMYDKTLLEPVEFTRPSSTPCNRAAWNAHLTPRLLGGCFAQQSTALGPQFAVRLRCIAPGTVTIELVHPAASPAGTTLFDVNASSIPTDLVGASVTCVGDPVPAIAGGSTVTPP